MNKQDVFIGLSRFLASKGGIGEEATKIGLSMYLDEDTASLIEDELRADLELKSTKYPDTVILAYCIGDTESVDDLYNKAITSAKRIQNVKNVVAILAYPSNDDTNSFVMDVYLLKKYKTKVNKINSTSLSTTVEEYFNLPTSKTFSIQDMVNTIWKCADILFGSFKSYEYGEIIIPLVVLKRIQQTFEEKQDEFNDKVKSIKEESPGISDDNAYKLAMAELGMTFCNIYPGGMDSVLSDHYACLTELRNYVDSFIVNGSDENSIKNILDKLKIDTVIDRLEQSEKGFYVLSSLFNTQIDLSSENVTTDEMGQIFESLIYLFNTAVGSGAGEHYTAPDIVKIMSNILTELVDINGYTTIDAYDMTMGTSQMLTVLEDYFKQKYAGEGRQIVLHGQKLNGYTFGIACADALLRGVNIDDITRNFKHGNTLTEDHFSSRKFDYIISNPPFGIPWSSEYENIYNESFYDAGGRFPFGLPAKSDGQMLFNCNGLSKLKDHGAMAIVHNGSPLFNGAAGSGEAQIRQGLLDNDYVTAIIKLPKDMFYNVGIVTYIWIIQKNKSADRKNKVWLIDASTCCKKLAKSIGNKRNEKQMSVEKLSLMHLIPQMIQ